MRIGIFGATGAVGREIVHVLRDRRFPATEIKLYASPRSAGAVIPTQLGDRTVEAFHPEAGRGLDFALLSVSGDFSREHARALAAQGPVVIDNSSALRLEADVPLAVPEANGASIGQARVIANPNCTTAILVVALHPLREAFGLKRVIVSTYQAASGAGADGMTELIEESKRVLVEGEKARAKAFRHPLAFNVIPHIDSFQTNGYTREEMKVAWETRKILDAPELLISCTAVRIPTMRVHAEAVTIETERPITPEAAREVLAKAPGLVVIDDPAGAQYPMPLTATGRYDVEVGRVRRNDVFGDRGLDFFLCGDQLLKGAALNAVQIAERIMEERRN